MKRLRNSPRHCEGGAVPPEAISNIVTEIASSPFGFIAMTGVM
ncbi:MAG: hypothetical protein AB1607_05180 [Chloroflexota bacterium]